jgi:hypothetical protein
MCEGTNIKTPAEELQTQDVAVRVKPVHSFTAQHKMHQYALSLGAVLRKADLLTKSGKG